MVARRRGEERLIKAAARAWHMRVSAVVAIVFAD